MNRFTWQSVLERTPDIASFLVGAPSIAFVCTHFSFKFFSVELHLPAEHRVPTVTTPRLPNCKYTIANKINSVFRKSFIYIGRRNEALSL
ncbi:hypothetical protein M378DRAFT_592095 [Amanita muscaria Koide BX008]|uniref:Uncharacterized protein n=1 Tax=Amanita muscaria (strain Koide BX008) TaxID=946122 RepID=A0A0C2X4V6_AMAMK|nr:hypothetical protein M378DRAFT_592095 [Amanita muscaria Koide BX008]